jgi:hypothetical protein
MAGWLAAQYSDASAITRRPCKTKRAAGCRLTAILARNEMIAKLIKAGYLRPEHLQDADAITSAIANMKQDDLRSGGSDDNGSAA